MSANGRKQVVLAVGDVAHAFGPIVALRELSFTVQHGEFVAIVGPSGCGKTTLLNLLSGTYTPTQGSVERVGGSRTVYQQGGLFPWLTVAENIRLGLRDLKDYRDQERQLADLLALIRLEGFREHYPHQLSGGMKQRVELARAMAGEAETLLMDEPFSALDYQTRLRMRRELLRLLQERPRTVIFVTHDIEEAVQLADRVLVLTERPGRISRELHLETPHPRSLTGPREIEAVEQVLEELGLRYEAEPPLPIEV